MICQIFENELATVSILARSENKVDSHASAISFLSIVKFYGCLPTFFGAPLARKVAQIISRRKKFLSSATTIDAQLDRENFAIYRRRVDRRSRKLSLLIDLSPSTCRPFMSSSFISRWTIISKRLVQREFFDVIYLARAWSTLLFSLTFLYTFFIFIYIIIFLLRIFANFFFLRIKTNTFLPLFFYFIISFLIFIIFSPFSPHTRWRIWWGKHDDVF